MSRELRKSLCRKPSERYDLTLSTPGVDMRRGKFIILIGGSAAAWPLTMKHIGVLMVLPADDPETQARYRWGGTSVAQNVAELCAKVAA